jgi:choline dehydrogenase-like flavoprotein
MIPNHTEMEAADYIVVDGGIGGCVIATRLSRHRPKRNVILIEAPPDVNNHPLVMTAATAQKVRTLDLNWSYPGIPQST